MSDPLSGIKVRRLPEKEREYLNNIFEGRMLAPLYSDIIAKAVFDPDKHPGRAEFLLRSITGDDTIKVHKSSRNEGIRISESSKGVIYDIPFWLVDRRLADLEFQKLGQNFIMKRGEIYTSNLLTIEYSAEEDESKKEVSFDDTPAVILVVLMVRSPKVFRDYDNYSQRYIHRFDRMTADSGLVYDPLAKTIYVQLDKCLKQFKEGFNAESENAKPDELQLWLSSVADINDRDVVQQSAEYPELLNIRQDVFKLGQDKEVQALITAEEFARLDYNSAKKEARELGMREGWMEGIEEGREEGRKVGRQEGRKAGIEEGRKEGIKEGRKEGIEEGRKEGIEEGRKEGIEEGRKEGIEEGRKEGIEEGRAVEVFSSVAQGDYPIQRGMEKLDMNEDEFRRRAAEAGYVIE